LFRQKRHTGEAGASNGAHHLHDAAIGYGLIATHKNPPLWRALRLFPHNGLQARHQPIQRQFRFLRTSITSTSGVTLISAIGR